MKKILLVEDEIKLNELLKEVLAEESYIVTSVFNGEEAILKAFSEKYDLLILDWMLPDIEGVDLVKKIREYHKGPIVMITAKDSDEDEIYALNKEIDEYIRKPFNLDIFLLRIEKILSKLSLKSKIYWNDILIDKKSAKCFKRGEELHLSPREYKLLLYFTDYPNILHTREKLLDFVWGFDYYGDIRTVDTHVKMLRKKLGRELIKTKRKLGYIMEVEFEDKE